MPATLPNGWASPQRRFTLTLTATGRQKLPGSYSWRILTYAYLPYLFDCALDPDYGRITAIYQKRWNVEVFHKSVKPNTGLARSPTHTVRTQSNHFFASIYAFFKLELLKIKHQLNHFALRSKLYIKALQASFAELQRLTA